MRSITALGLLIIGVIVSSADGAERECITCHSEQASSAHFRHVQAGVTCIDCHGKSTEHASRSSSAADIVFRPADQHDVRDADAESQQCLACHNDSSRAHWPASIHKESDLSCSDCHQSHGKKDLVLDRRAGQAVCLTCHVELKFALKLPSRHPIEALETTCADCHASHGSAGDSGELREHSVNETCVSCHKEKRGPFLFEHDPVAEDCLLCHQPHGSAQPSLLISRPPFLCQQCHMSSDHPGRVANGRQLQSRDNNLLAGGCLNCHGAIHGSNHPSGARLTR